MPNCLYFKKGQIKVIQNVGTGGALPRDGREGLDWVEMPVQALRESKFFKEAREREACIHSEIVDRSMVGSCCASFLVVW
jgi:hypothetical protein